MRAAASDKVAFSSTAAVYGEPEVRPSPETHPLNPVNPYGRSKLMVEEVLRAVSAAQRLCYCAALLQRGRGRSQRGQPRDRLFGAGGDRHRRGCGLAPPIKAREAPQRPDDPAVVLADADQHVRFPAGDLSA